MHAAHAVAPLLAMKRPAAQRTHVPRPACGCAVPGLHGAAAAAPVEQEAPAGHSTQSSALVIEIKRSARVAFSYRPEGHGSAADAPSAQYEPAVHLSHAVAAATATKRPATHGVHVAEEVSAAAVPGLQGAGCAAPVEQKWPEGHGAQSPTLVMTVTPSPW